MAATLHRRAVLHAALAACAVLCGAAAPAADGSRLERGLLWRVEPAGAMPSPVPSHLYGTLHVADARLARLSPAVRIALGNARLYLPELRTDAASEREFAAAARLPPGHTLAQLAGPEAFERVARVLGNRYGVPHDAVLSMKPWAAYLTLGQRLSAGGDIVDALLLRQALRLGLPVRPLETVQQQIDALDAVPLPALLTLLDALARDHDAAQARVPALIDAYLAQDLAAIRRAEEAPAAADPELRAPLAALIAQLVDRRNALMVASLAPELEAGGAFVAVGALHLHGERGLLALLAQAGWRVQGIDLNARPAPA